MTPSSLSRTVDSCNVMEKLHNVMRMLKTPSKFVNIFDIWGIDLSGPFRSLKRTSDSSSAVDYLPNGLKRESASPTMMPELLAISGIFSLALIWCSPCNQYVDRGNPLLYTNDQFAKIKDFLGTKLKSRWKWALSPSLVYFHYGTVELSQANGPNFKDCPGSVEDSLFCHSQEVYSSASFGKSDYLILSSNEVDSSKRQKTSQKDKNHEHGHEKDCAKSQGQ
ncbi:hypothetical protein Tco_0097093 [Tanacetum coccineum]